LHSGQRTTFPGGRFVITITSMRLRAAFVSAAVVAAFTVAWPVSALAAHVTGPGGGPVQAARSHATNGSVNTSVKTPITPRGSWPVYHRDDAHTGSDPTLPGLTNVTQGWTSPAFDDEVYASPVVYGGIVYAVTLNNTVYALNQADGSLLPGWPKHLRAPEGRSPGAPGGPSCGNVVPQGILGTPVIDPGSDRIYVTTLGSDDIYRVEGIHLVSGVADFSVNISASMGSGFNWKIEQERAAMAVHNGYAYVAFGGRAGDCGNYSGWVVGVPIAGGTVHVFQTSNTGNGIWNAGGIVVDDSTGNLFVTTGNGVNNGSGDGCSADISGNPIFQNDAVVKLTPTLSESSFFMPIDWQANWCANDQDLGGAGPVLISPNLLFQAGKWGTGFLLNPTALGGVDGQQFPTPNGVDETADVCLGNHGDATFASFAYAAPFVYVECENRGLVALHVNTSGPSFGICSTSCSAPDWHVDDGTQFGPPIVAAGAVWAASDGNGLYAFSASTGALLYQSAGFGINRFVTPAEAGGQVFVPAHNVIIDFDMSFGNAQSVPQPPPARPTPNVQSGAPPPPIRHPVVQSSPAPPPGR
jgi:outer membrane protein assembly factor BamB